MSDDDAALGARTALGGRRLNLTTDEIFAWLKGNPRISPKEINAALRSYNAMQVGLAVERLEKATDGHAKLSALFALARILKTQMKDRLPGWFRLIVALGSQPGESMFRLSYERRPHSKKAQLEHALLRGTDTRRSIDDMFVAGAILSRTEAAKRNGDSLTVQDAIGEAINCGDLATDEEAARKAFQRFRIFCAQLTGGRNTYRLERYVGPIEKYQSSWMALPDIGADLTQLPSAKGGRPKT